MRLPPGRLVQSSIVKVQMVSVLWATGIMTRGFGVKHRKRAMQLLERKKNGDARPISMLPHDRPCAVKSVVENK